MSERFDEEVLLSSSSRKQVMDKRTFLELSRKEKEILVWKAGKDRQIRDKLLLLIIESSDDDKLFSYYRFWSAHSRLNRQVSVMDYDHMIKKIRNKITGG